MSNIVYPKPGKGHAGWDEHGEYTYFFIKYSGEKDKGSSEYASKFGGKIGNNGHNGGLKLTFSCGGSTEYFTKTIQYDWSITDRKFRVKLRKGQSVKVDAYDYAWSTSKKRWLDDNCNEVDDCEDYRAKIINYNDFTDGLDSWAKSNDKYKTGYKKKTGGTSMIDSGWTYKLILNGSAYGNGSCSL